jgi:uncharacterized iron-regulated membrane protein
MKLSAHAFSRFWDVHAWSGVLGGLVLYVMFITGAITLFHEELEIWQEPMAQQAPAVGTHQAQFERALANLPSRPASVWFYPKAHGAAELGYTDPKTDTWHKLSIDGPTGELVPERERLADFLYGLHFLWHEATGDWLYRCSGFLAVLLLLAIATGVLIHLKDFVRQFHQFRPGKSRRVLWSDLHKVLGVMGLPFQILYAYTGALIVLAPLLLGAFVRPVFGGDEKRAEVALWGMPGFESGKAGPSAQVLALDELAERARRAAPRLVPDSYRVLHPGRENGLVDVQGTIRGTTPEPYGAVRLRLQDGRVIAIDSPATETAMLATWRWVRGLHYAYFGGITLRFLFFALALATAGTLLTGNWIWLARREARRRSAGNRLLARLTAGVGAGTLVATAALFLVSRVLPFDFAGRGPTEEMLFLVVFTGCIAWGFASPTERAVWWQQLGAAGLLLLPVPLLATRWSTAGLFGSGARIPAVVGVDIALLGVAFALFAVALALRRAATRPAESPVAVENLRHQETGRTVAVLSPGGRDG